MSAFAGNSIRYCRSSMKHQLEYGILEARSMLAGVFFDAVEGTVTLEGSHEADVVTLDYNESNQIVVESEIFSGEISDEYQLFIFRCRGGDDTFTNNTELNSRAFGTREMTH